MSASKLISPLLDTRRNKDFSKFMPEYCEHQWKIPFKRTETQRIINTRVFSKDRNAHFEWKVEFHPRYSFPFGNDFLPSSLPYSSIFLKLMKKKFRTLDIFAECRFFIKTEAGKTIVSKKGKLVKHEFWGIYLFYDWTKLSKLGRVPIILGVRVSARYNCNSPLMVYYLPAKNEFDDYLDIFEDGRSCEVILRTKLDGTELKFNRSMLTSRSKVFEAMFSNEMKEKLTGFVEIHEFSGYIMRCVLRFIYNGTVDFRDFSFALNLLEAAEYFGLNDLKNRCAAYLLECLDLKHAWQILLNAHLFCVKELKVITLEFIRVNKIVLGDSEEYRTFPADLLLEIIKAFAKKV